MFIFSFMMVGDPFSGKTKVLQVLAETLNVLTDRGYDDENVNKVQLLAGVLLHLMAIVVMIPLYSV